MHKLSPSFLLGDNHRFRRDSSWQQVVVDYQANGEEAFIMIANFAHNDTQAETGTPFEDRFFILLDNVSLQPLQPAEQICSNWIQAKDDIYGQNERHEYLQRSVKHRREQGPLKLLLQPTHQFTIDTLLLPDMLFATGKKDLQVSSFRLLDSFCRTIAGTYFSEALILPRGRGSRQPVADNETLPGRQLNRRVELLVYFHE